MFKQRSYRYVIAAPVVAASLLAAGTFGITSLATGSGASTTHSAAAKTGYAAPGRMVQAQTSSKPFVPTAAQQAQRTAQMNMLASLPKAPVGPHTTAANVAQLKGPQTSPTSSQVSPTAFKILKTIPIPASCSGCGQSTVNEPDTANSGKVILQTSNWNMVDTTNGGAASPTLVYQNPYSLDANFCCDQAVTYVPSRDRFIYEGLDLGSGSAVGFDIGVAPGKLPTSWCIYHFSAASFNSTAGNLLDYPKIAFANNNLYVTWNEYSGSSWIDTGLARFPIDSLAACAGFGFNYLTRNDNFTFGLTYGQSSLNTFYWVSNWYTSSGGSGSSERIFNWPENSGTYFLTDVGVTPYSFSGGSCASQDGVVTDWCSRLDPRWETAWISRAEYNAQANSAFAGDTILGVTITAGPGGGDPFPYVIYEYFKLNGPSFIQTSATFNNGFAFAYAGCAPNDLGYVGCVMSWGGGTGTGSGAVDYYPGGLILIQDDVSPTQPWNYSFNLFGHGNASAWGDYDVTQPFQPNVGPFLATEWAVSSGGAVTPQIVIWGRVRDTNGYNRWKSV